MVKLGRPRKGISERFWPKVKIATYPPDACWEWVGAKNSNGYGHIGDRGSHKKAHRVSWEIHNGPIPSGSLCLHKCDNKSCVNPSHLYIGNHSDNAKDMIERGGQTFNPPLGSKHWASKLNEENALEIRRLYSEGSTTYLELSTKFNVSPESVRDVIKGITWRHV